MTDKEFTDFIHELHALTSVCMRKPGCERDGDAAHRIAKKNLTRRYEQGPVKDALTYALSSQLSINENGLDVLRKLYKTWSEDANSAEQR
jgi:hypothetical protein